MKIDNVNVWGLEESEVAAGLAMNASFSAKAFRDAVESAQLYSESTGVPRLERLSSTAVKSGVEAHCNALTGVVVQANVTATNSWWLQMERYHFVQIVTMQSKMHRLREMLKQQGTAGFHGLVSPELVAWLKKLDSMDEPFEELVYNCPLGLELTARISTNYQQLRTIWKQRHNHKLKEWRDFCEWVETLPAAEKLIVTKNADKTKEA